jgi:hypothetical protein
MYRLKLAAAIKQQQKQMLRSRLSAPSIPFQVL